VPTDKLHETLISAADIVDSGHIIILESEQAIIENISTRTQSAFPRDRASRLWRMPLQALELLSNNAEARIKDCHRDITRMVYSARISIDNNYRTVRERVMSLHTRMNHASEQAMCTACAGPDAAWKNTGVTASQIRSIFRNEQCPDCVLGKRNIDPPAQTPAEDRRQWGPGECIVGDPVPAISPQAMGGETCTFEFVCMGTGYLHSIPSRNKTSQAYIEALDIVIEFYKSHKYITRVVRTDAEFNLRSELTDRYLADRHIQAEHSTPFRHHQNGVERHIQTVIKGVATIMHAQPWLRADAWTYALYSYTATRNHTPNAHSGNKSPHQMVTGQTTDLSRIFRYSFGDFVAVGIPKELRNWKFDVRNEVGIYVGQPEGSIGHLVYDPYTHKVLERGSVNRIDISDLQFLKWYSRRHTMRESSLPYKIITDAFHSFIPNSTQQAVNTSKADPSFDFTTSPQPQQSLHPQVLNKRTASQVSDWPAHELERLTIPAEPLRPGQRSPYRNIVSERVLRSAAAPHMIAAALALVASSNDISQCYEQDTIDANCFAARKTRSADSPTVRQALNGQDRDKWIEAIGTEVTELLSNTLTPVAREDMAQSYSLINTTTQLKAKRKSTDGTIEKFKARTCARGDQLKGVLGADQTYSPTIFLLTFSVIFHLAIILKMFRRTIDTVAAYLYQKYPTEADRKPLYVRLEKLVAEVCGLDPQQIYQVMRYLYGLPDAGKAYYAAVSGHLISNGYTISKLDPCLFYRVNADETTYITLHVDDTFVCSTTETGMDRVSATLEKEFRITTNDNADSYLGVHLESLPDGAVKLTQPKLLQSIFDEFNPAEHTRSYRHQAIPTPARPRSSSLGDDSSSSQPIEQRTYLHLLGALMYLTRSRPDIMSATSFASTKSKSPTVADYDELLHIVDYLFLTQDKGLILRTSSSSDTNLDLQLICYVDASYLIHPDSRSHTGYTMSFGNLGHFYSKSSKQQLVATSSTHAEMRAVFTLIKDIIFVVELCREIGQALQSPVIVFEDNQPVITLAMTDSTGIKKCKHFQMLIAYVKEQVELGLLELHKVSTERNVSDPLSKPVHGSDFQYKTQQLLGQQSGEPIYQPAPSRKRAASDNEEYNP